MHFSSEKDNLVDTTPPRAACGVRPLPGGSFTARTRPRPPAARGSRPRSSSTRACRPWDRRGASLRATKKSLRRRRRRRRPPPPQPRRRLPAPSRSTRTDPRTAARSSSSPRSRSATSGWSSKASVEVERRRGVSGSKPRDPGRKDTPGEKVLKKRRSPRERGRTGTSLDRPSRRDVRRRRERPRAREVPASQRVELRGHDRLRRVPRRRRLRARLLQRLAGDALDDPLLHDARGLVARRQSLLEPEGRSVVRSDATSGRS
eukprot:30306-Pelagococcus_subviridis.AAC.9